ncbi:MAG: hypothetical protein ACRDNW_17480 [Trebonia sp.]
MNRRAEYQVLIVRYGRRSTTRSDVFLNVVSGHNPGTLGRFTRADGPPGADVAVIGRTAA